MSKDSRQTSVFLITGCSSGLGLELAYAVLATGHRLIATSRNPAGTPGLVSKITSLGGDWATLDVISSDIESQLNHCLGIYGRIDVLINNAGIGMGGALEDFG
jgi:NAD(P)-dependent dehydrogenase (short-subunit alcohol dehydrogenase family)